MVTPRKLLTHAGTVRKNPTGATRSAIGGIQQSFLGLIGKGTFIFEEDWDVLILLDACRVDVAKQVAPEYEFIGSVQTRYSTGSTSRQWMKNNFSRRFSDKMSRTAYVTANPYSDELCNGDDVAYLDEVWDYASDSEIGVVRPRAITDRAIAAYRSSDVDRLLVHYMQPHLPLLHAPDRDVRREAINGEITHQEALQEFTKNLRAVLDEVDLLLSNIEGDKIVITADHGEGFGERGILGHPTHRLHPVLRHVPWIETTASGGGDYQPNDCYPSEDGLSRNEKLEALGYL